METPAVEAAPVVETPAPETYAIRHNGQEHQLTRDELIERAQQGFDYTQKTQALAQQRQLAEQMATAFRNERERVATILQDRAALEAHLASLAPAEPQFAADDIPTIEQTRQLLQQEVEQVRRKIMDEVQSAQFTAETSRLEQNFRAEIDTTVSSLLTEKFPTLAEWLDPSDAQEIIRTAAAKFVNAQIQANPQQAVNIADVKRVMVEAAQKQADRIEKKIKDNAKMQVARGAKLTQQGIEPPGGTPPAPPAPQKFKLGDRALTQSVIEELNKAFASA